jgi:hypothetical protein
LSILEIFKAIAAVLGRRRLLIPMPMAVARLTALFSQFLKTPPITSEQLKMLERPNVCRFEEAEKEFGVFFTPFKAAISTYLAD